MGVSSDRRHSDGQRSHVDGRPVQAESGDAHPGLVGEVDPGSAAPVQDPRLLQEDGHVPLLVRSHSVYEEAKMNFIIECFFVK